MTHPTDNDATPATDSERQLDVESWIKLSECFLKAVRAIPKLADKKTENADHATENQKGDDLNCVHAALVMRLVWSGSVLASLALADPLSFVSREAARAISFLVRQARRDDLLNLWSAVIATSPAPDCGSETSCECQR